MRCGGVAEKRSEHGTECGMERKQAEMLGSGEADYRASVATRRVHVHERAWRWILYRVRFGFGKQAEEQP